MIINIISVRFMGTACIQSKQKSRRPIILEVAVKDHDYYTIDRTETTQQSVSRELKYPD